MLVSKKWLQDFIVEKLPETEKMENEIIMRAFEVESVEKVGDDDIFDIKVLPDRAHYALSHRGVAREVSAIFDLTFKDIIPEIEIKESKKLKISIEDSGLCRRYIGVFIENIKVSDSPAWLKERLESIGQKSINNIVDATNYVMFSLGQPLHAFDADKVKGGIVARAGKEGEVLNLLDASGVADKKDRTIELGKGECVIADDSGPLVLVGIKGGLETAISNETKNIIVEAANFDPVITRKFSTIYNLRNESSKRFENEITPEYAMDGLKMVVELILKIAGGEVEGFIDVYPNIFPKYKVGISESEILKISGVEIKNEDIEKILKRLGFEYEFVQKAVSKVESKYIVTVPSDRLDIRIKEDLVEEIIRIYGYESVISNIPKIENITVVNQKYAIETIIRETLLDNGFTEVYTYAFQPKGEIELLNSVAKDKNFMRDSLSFAFDSALSENAKYADLLGLDKIKIFEIGDIFKKTGEENHLCIGIKYVKKIKGENPKDELLKILESICEKLGVKSEIKKYGILNENSGILEINLDILSKDVSQEISMPKLVEREVKKYVPFSPYPFVVRDIAVWVEGDSKEAELEKIIKDEAGILLKRLTQFDVFSKDGKTSYAYRLILQSMEKTLEESEINKIMDSITQKMNSNEGWQVR